MARKDLLKGLMEQAVKPLEESERDNSAAVKPPAPSGRYSKGAIGAVSQSIAELKSRSVSDIDPFLIDAGGFQDRLEHDEVEHKALMASISEYGQQVPVLVRPHPETPDRYQIVYGRRRVLALRDLGQTVKAMIRDLDDDALVMAQGQENTARRDLSYIEKANFARQMSEAGYKRKVICDAINIDKTVISRMLNVIDHLPIELIEAIGAAPSVGRDRWSAMAELFGKSGFDGPSAIGVINLTTRGNSSDARFNSLMKALESGSNKAKSAEKPQPVQHKLRNASGIVMGRVSVKDDKVSIELKPSKAGGFDRWLVENMEEIHRDWVTKNGG
mgnify:CR=1 FL=1